jgi:hypothetical protein
MNGAIQAGRQRAVRCDAESRTEGDSSDRTAQILFRSARGHRSDVKGDASLGLFVAAKATG